MNGWLTGGLAVVSLALWPGWVWLICQTESWRNLSQRWPGRAAEFFYFVGLPYLALIFGLLPPRLLGLKGLEYLLSISTMSPLTDLRQALTLWLVTWGVDMGAMLIAGLLALLVLGGVTWSLARYGLNGLTPVEQAGYQPLHWAFYWAIFWQLTGDLYLGVVFGAVWALVEAGLAAWAGQTWPAKRPQFLAQAMLLALTSAMFFYRPNLWLLWPIYGMMVALTRKINPQLREPEISGSE